MVANLLYYTLDLIQRIEKMGKGRQLLHTIPSSNLFFVVMRY